MTTHGGSFVPQPPEFQAGVIAPRAVRPTKDYDGKRQDTVGGTLDVSKTKRLSLILLIVGLVVAIVSFVVMVVQLSVPWAFLVAGGIAFVWLGARGASFTQRAISYETVRAALIAEAARGRVPEKPISQYAAGEWPTLDQARALGASLQTWSAP